MVRFRAAHRGARQRGSRALLPARGAPVRRSCASPAPPRKRDGAAAVFRRQRLTPGDRQLSLDAVEGEGLPTLDELASVVEARVGEPAARLSAAIELSRELTDLGDSLIGRFVA